MKIHSFIHYSIILNKRSAMVGILPFLIQWLALSKFSQTPSSSSSTLRNPTGTGTHQPGGTQTGSSTYIDPHHHHSYHPPKSHWTLLNEFADLPEDEIELFLPQVCNIILDNESYDQYGIFHNLERIIIDKCAKSLPFGLKVSHLLKVYSNQFSKR